MHEFGVLLFWDTVYVTNFSAFSSFIGLCLSTADIDTFISLFVLCAFLLAMTTPVPKTFTTDVEQMQRRRHHMTARGLYIYNFIRQMAAI